MLKLAFIYKELKSAASFFKHLLHNSPSGFSIGLFSGAAAAEEMKKRETTQIKIKASLEIKVVV